MIRFFSFFLIILLIVLGFIVAIDNYFYSIAFFPQKIKDLNIIELVMIPLVIHLFMYLGRISDSQKRKAELESGKLLGSALCQRLNIKPMTVNDSPQLFLTWIDTMSVSMTEMATACGDSFAAEELNNDCQRALALKTMISPVLSNLSSLLAVSKFISKQSAWLQTFSGNKKLFIIIPAIEDRAEVVTKRFFEIPPSMLLLFIEQNLTPYIRTVRLVQSYRFVAMKIISHQVVNNAGELPRWDEFSPTSVFAVRELPHSLEDGEVDWWDERWSFDPRSSITELEIKNKSESLKEELFRRAGCKVSKNQGFPFSGDQKACDDLSYVMNNLASIPKGRWF